jgi:hypothetical protein
MGSIARNAYITTPTYAHSVPRIGHGVEYQRERERLLEE